MLHHMATVNYGTLFAEESPVASQIDVFDRIINRIIRTKIFFRYFSFIIVEHKNRELFHHQLLVLVLELYQSLQVEQPKLPQIAIL